MTHAKLNMEGGQATSDENVKSVLEKYIYSGNDGFDLKEKTDGMIRQIHEKYDVDGSEDSLSITEDRMNINADDDAQQKCDVATVNVNVIEEEMKGKNKEMINRMLMHQRKTH